MGALPARRLRQVKQVAVEQFDEPQPLRSWEIYLRYKKDETLAYLLWRKRNQTGPNRKASEGQ